MFDYQGIKLSKYKRLIKAVNDHHCIVIVSISDNMESKFEGLKQFPVFKNMVSLVQTQTWAAESIDEFSNYLVRLLN